MVKFSEDQEMGGATGAEAPDDERYLREALEERVGELEDELQAQREELEVQNEELRVQMEELNNKNIELEKEIAERKQAEDALRKQADLIDLSPDAIIIRRLDGTITFWSHGAELLYGWTKTEAISRMTHDLIRTKFPVPLENINKQLIATGRWSGELVHATKDGREVIVQSWWLVRKDHQGNISEIMESNVDITGRKHIEKKISDLASELQEQARIVDLAHVIISDPDSSIVFWSSGDEKLYGYTKEEAIGRVSHELFKTVFPVSKERVDEALEKNGHWEGELIQTAKGGHKVYVASHQVLYRENGVPSAILEVNNDITEQKRLEIELRGAKDRVELYLDIMGHDINNLNQVIIGTLELMMDDRNLTGEHRDMLVDALNSARGSASIIDNVRKIQAINEGRTPMQQEDINGMILDCIRDMPKPEDRLVTVNYAPRERLMIVGTALMTEVFCNLINNAVKHSDKDISIDISVDETTRYGKKFYDVSVADNGPGIPDDLKPKLFNRFQRGSTKAHGKGLGLFIVKSLVEQAGGNVTVGDRVPGDFSRGAKFTVTLPAYGGPK